MVHTLHTSVNSLHIFCRLKSVENLSTEITYVTQQSLNLILVLSERYPCLLMQSTNFEVMIGLADVDGFKICIEVCI